ncbi:MAG: YaiO family outer membrane beta-barrel protein [Proteobacteria bacterium]|nr:YaiO family outer membrane beta-barrel protein [Pseudomonadota bacterium]
MAPARADAAKAAFQFVIGILFYFILAAPVLAEEARVSGDAAIAEARREYEKSIHRAEDTSKQLAELEAVAVELSGEAEALAEKAKETQLAAQQARASANKKNDWFQKVDKRTNRANRVAKIFDKKAANNVRLIEKLSAKLERLQKQAEAARKEAEALAQKPNAYVSTPGWKEEELARLTENYNRVDDKAKTLERAVKKLHDELEELEQRQVARAKKAEEKHKRATSFDGKATRAMEKTAAVEQKAQELEALSVEYARTAAEAEQKALEAVFAAEQAAREVEDADRAVMEHKQKLSLLVEAKQSEQPSSSNEDDAGSDTNKGSKANPYRLDGSSGFDLLIPYETYGTLESADLTFFHTPNEKLTYSLHLGVFIDKDDVSVNGSVRAIVRWTKFFSTDTSVTSGMKSQYIPLTRFDHAFNFVIYERKVGLVLTTGVTYFLAHNKNQDVTPGLCLTLYKGHWNVSYRLNLNIALPGEHLSLSHIMSTGYIVEDSHDTSLIFSFGEQNYTATYLPEDVDIENKFLSAHLYHRHWIGRSWGLFGRIGYVRLFGEYHQIVALLGGFLTF